MIKPKVIVLSGYGLNCEEETKFAFEMAKAKADIIHINDLIVRPARLENYQIMALPGGFSYGDDTGSGNAYAIKLKNHLWEEILSFMNRDTLTIGICNGCQILVNMGLLPALSKEYGQRQIALIHNNLPRYTVRWVDLKIENKTPWLAGLKTISLPIAHGEGKFFAYPSILAKLKKDKLIAARFVRGEICRYQFLPTNPNGSLDNIAALTDPTKRILGIMPHPERAVFFTQLPHWTWLKEKYLRAGKKLPRWGPSLTIFQNAVKYFK